MTPGGWLSYFFPSVPARVAAMFDASFRPIKRRVVGKILAVEYLNYGIVGGVQIFLITDARITIESILINDEFRPSLFAPYEEGTGACARRGLPRELCGYWASVIAITDAPTASPGIRSRCYGKPVMKVDVSTNRGDFVFQMGETI